MLFSRDKDENKNTGKSGPSLMGFLFKPDIAGSIRPIGESIAMFVQLIALIFVSNGLFPRNHPALMGDRTVRLTMGEVIRTAWGNLRFERDNVLQIILFFGVVGSLAIMGLVAILGVFSLFTGTAHAQMFTAPNPNADLAHNWLGYLFKGEAINIPITDAQGQPINVPQPQNIQTALRAGLAMYSTAVLVIAGFILLYHLVHMIAETAHTGKVMGNANQIWAPIRLVVAIGLLIPVADTSLNTGQYIAIQVADWGSGLASNVWKTFLKSVAAQGANVILPPIPQVADAVKDVARMYACLRSYNYYLDQQAPALGAEVVGKYYIYAPSGVEEGPRTNFVFGNRLPGEEEICGAYSFTSPPKTDGASDLKQADIELQQKIYQAGRSAFTSSENLMKTVADNYLGPMLGDNSQTDIVATNASLWNAIKEYRSRLEANLKSALGAKKEPAIERLAEKWSDLGWVTAGAWFNTMARTQGLVHNTAVDSLPRTKAPDLDRMVRFGTRDPNIMEGDGFEIPGSAALGDAAKIYKGFNEWLEKGSDRGIIYAKAEFDKMGSDATALVNKRMEGQSSFFSGLMYVVQEITVDQRLFNDKGTMIGTTANPLAELAAMGQKNIILTFQLIDKVLVPGAFGSMIKNYNNDFTKFLGSHSALGMSMIVLVCTLLFTTGLLLAYVIPLLPFTLFFFNVLTWIVSVFESVVSMPLFALAHLTTKGEGIHGDMAKQGYFFLLAIMLRPVLMVFGLIASLLIFYVAISFLNMTYFIATSGVSGYESEAFNTFSRIVFNVFYAIFAYICANSAFKTINFFAENALTWMNSRGPTTEKMGDKQLMSTATTAMTAYGFKDSMGSLLSQNTEMALAIQQSPGSVAKGIKWTSGLKGAYDKGYETGGHEGGVKEAERYAQEHKQAQQEPQYDPLRGNYSNPASLNPPTAEKTDKTGDNSTQHPRVHPKNEDQTNAQGNEQTNPTKK